jgi:ABC-2 type transport system ATP-binding protein
MDKAIRLAGVRKAFRRHLSLGSIPVLHGISLEVAPGSVHGLLGPNGAGKTTTLRILLGLIRPDAGTVEIHGRPASDPASRSGLGFLPENPWFYDYLTGREFLDFSARLAGVAPGDRAAEVGRVIDRVGMKGRADTPLRRCSKGMVQRIGMAQALLGSPRILVLDEPMSGLDPIGRREFRDIILERRAAGCTVFFSSHILQDAEMICDRVTIMDKGQVAAEGDLASLLGRDIRFWEVTLQGVDPSALISRVEVLRTSGNEMIARVHTQEDLDILLRAAVDRGARIRSVTPCRDTLEDIFLREVRGRSAAPRAAGTGPETAVPVEPGPSVEEPQSERDAVHRRFGGRR